MMQKRILKFLLEQDLRYNASKLGFIQPYEFNLTKDFLYKCIGVLDQLSLKKDPVSQKQLISISALLWTYRNTSWTGLKDYLVLFLSRAGYGPTSIMIDNESAQDDSYNYANTSMLNQMAVAINQVTFEIEVKDQSFLLTEFQKSVWDLLDQAKLIGISAPTSAGKSFVLALKTIELLLKDDGNLLYIVPTLSLVSQVSLDYKNLLDLFGSSDYNIETSYTYEAKPTKKIFVLTQEKAIAAFAQSGQPFGDLSILVVDEIQNVERVADADEQRAKVLYDFMVEIQLSSKIQKIVLSGPRIEKIDQLGFQIFGVPSEKVETQSSPVVSITYSISLFKKQYKFNLYSDVLDAPLSLEIKSNEQIKGYGGALYNTAFLEYLATFVRNLGANQNNIIFAPTTTTSRRLAGSLISNSGTKEDAYLNSLSQYLKNTVHAGFALSDTVKQGIAYHHGKLPHHVRTAVEEAIKSKKIQNVICTTTLLPGVNLPVQNIVVRNPNLFIKAKGGKKPKLSKYEIANLRGRAGRLLKDFIGRTFILEESSFQNEEVEEQGSLFDNFTKELRVGYNDKFRKHETSIKTDLLNGIGTNDKNSEYSYLTTYIRQSILRKGGDAQGMLKGVGIEFTKGELKTIEEQLATLNLPVHISSMNRYWDPVDLAFLNSRKHSVDLPTGVNEASIAARLKKVIQFFQQNLPLYYNRYFKVAEIPNKDLLIQKCYLTENWLKEHTLKTILSSAYYNDTDKIEDAISDLQNKISFGLPMLIKPLYDIKHPTSMFPRFIEVGAFHPITRKIMEMNVPRETAIFIRENFSLDANLPRKELIQALKRIKPQLSYWDSLQLQLI